MNQDKRNKKNAKYLANVERRDGITKKFDYLDVVSDGIAKKEGIHPMNGKFEFVTTRNKHGNIVTRSKYTYNWTKQAKAIQKLYHETKKGIEEKPKIPKETFFDKEHTKEEIKEYFNKKKEAKLEKAKELPFSKFHFDLLSNLYMNPAINVLKKSALREKHEAKIADIIAKMREKKNKKSNTKNLESLEIATKIAA